MHVNYFLQKLFLTKNIHIYLRTHYRNYIFIKIKMKNKEFLDNSRVMRFLIVSLSKTDKQLAIFVKSRSSCSALRQNNCKNKSVCPYVKCAEEQFLMLNRG